MPQLVHERLLDLMDRHGTPYRRALVYAKRQPAGTWVAWVEFVSMGGERVLDTERETTQSTLKGVTYWASGLPPTYFEAALERAFRRAHGARPPLPSARATPSGLVAFTVRTRDPAVAFRVMPTRTRVPGNRRELHEGAAVIYVRTVQPALVELPRVYEFLAQFRSVSAAGILARQLEADLRDTDAVLEVRGEEIPIEGTAIREALLA